MLNFCFCRPEKRSTFNTKSQYYPLISQRLNDNEQVMLQLIYSDLAARNEGNRITMENFLLFFNLTGLWGAKLFRQFNEDGRKLISMEEFFYGLSLTAKASFDEKIQFLFNFFKDREEQGIKYIDFTKMLYNYSRDELKEILMEDRCVVSQLNPALGPSISVNDSDCGSLQLASVRKIPSTIEKVIELNYEEPKQPRSKFEESFAEYSEYRDPGTCVQIKLKEQTYKINYCNMITLVKQFAKKIYQSYDIDTKTGRLSFEQFSKWIKSHTKLFQSYYTTFHIDLWSYDDNEPHFLNKVQKEFVGRLLEGGNLRNIYAMLVGDVLVLANSYKQRKKPWKVICLEGLEMHEVDNEYGYGIEITHRDEHYPHTIIYFDNTPMQKEYFKSFSVYQGSSLHDNYDIFEVIGTGQFSIVYRCVEKKSGRCYALKDIALDKLKSEAVAILNNESELMRIINYPQIVKHQETIRSKTHIYIIAEYIPGKDLFEYVSSKKRLSEYDCAFIIGEIISAVSYLHSLEIVHRDLKPENIMVIIKNKQKTNEEYIETIKIIDFGLSGHISELEKNVTKGVTGTPNYIAPEIILGDKLTCKIDNFAIGSILYFLLCGKLAFAHCNVEETLINTIKGNYSLSGGRWDTISSEAKDLIKKLLHPDPTERIELQEALNHEWFSVAKKMREVKLQAAAQPVIETPVENSPSTLAVCNESIL